MHSRRLITIFCVLSALAGIQAETVLITAGLEDQKQITEWLRLSIPTYEYLGGYAFAEVPPASIPVLQERGFVVEVIDLNPWSAQYFLLTHMPGVPDQIPGSILWQESDLHLVKIGEDDLIDLYTRFPAIQPLRKRVLSDHFWEQQLRPIASIRTLQWDPFIQSIVDQVTTDSLTSYIQRLEDFRSRLCFTDSSFASSQWLWQKFGTWGYTPEYDSFYVDSTEAAWGHWPDTGYERNVVATLPGSGNPEDIYIICGHFDAVVWWDTALARINAPGADDNASGTVAALEAARIFSNYTWEPTIQFIGWGVEELGLIGSYDYAHRAESLGMEIGGVVNLDMVGYMDDANLDCIIQRRDNASLWLSDIYQQAAQLYVPQLLVYPRTSGGGSDWYPFAVYGFPSVGAAERAGSHYNPQYHDTTDLLVTLSPQLYSAITKASVATIAVLASYPSLVEDVTAHDLGDGDRLLVNWSANPESDIIGYNVCWGRVSQTYSDTNFVAGINTTDDTLSGLMTDTTYYIAVTAVDADSNESYGAVEITGVPRITPLPPSGVTGTPIISGIRIDWLPNGEADLDGYRVYRRINDSPIYDSLNTILLQDTTFTNAPLSGADRYYYAVRAFDVQGNASQMSEEAYGRPITMDQGILVVDETRNGINPPDSLQDEFYRFVMDGYIITEYDYGLASERPVFADLAPYSTVVWFADDYSQMLAYLSTEALEHYLDYSGNLWFVGWKPIANLRGIASYPMTFTSGSFIYDYLKVAEVDLSGANDSFQMAVGASGYIDIAVDTAKVPVPNWGTTLRSIEGYTSTAPGDDIYTMDMQNNGSPFEGAVCGIRYLGPDHKCVLFGFPFYYMDREQGRLVARKVMDDFGEVVVHEMTGGPAMRAEFMMRQNTPNPFSDVTTIAYHLSQPTRSRMEVFNVAGQHVVTLVDQPESAGLHTISWSGIDTRGRRVSSGIYFCVLETDEGVITRKMMLLR